MSYTGKQKKQHIYELQTYLQVIAEFSEGMPKIVPDGIYGSVTEAAVKAFQREYGLAETGSTDPLTWNRIVKVYREKLNSEPIPCKVFTSGDLSDSGEETVYFIQVMLKGIGGYYDNFPKCEINGRYDEQTAEAVSEFQKHAGLEPSGRLDCMTWNMLVHFTEYIGKERRRKDKN